MIQSRTIKLNLAKSRLRIDYDVNTSTILSHLAALPKMGRAMCMLIHSQIHTIVRAMKDIGWFMLE